MDKEEFLQLVNKHRDEFFRFVLRTVWDSSVADDVFASAVLAAFENRHKFTPGTNFRAWMFKILLNKCFVANRETMRAFDSVEETGAELTTLDSYPGYNDILADPEKFLELCGDEVYRAFRRISPAERTCLLLRVVERFSYQEIADVLEMPVGTVMTHLARGRAKLRKELLDYATRNGYVRNYPKLVELKKQERKTAQGGS